MRLDTTARDCGVDPAGETTAQVCEWLPGPGAEFFIGWVAGQAKNDFKVSRLRRLTCS
jgi:hypothetical protein